MRRQFITRATLTAGLLLGLAAGALAVATPAAAADRSAPTLSKSTVQRGESFTISGTGCWEPDRAYKARGPWLVSDLGGWFSGRTETQEWHEGAWSMTLTAGAHVPSGAVPIRMHCYLETGEFDYPTVSVTVIGPPLPQDTPAPPLQDPTAPRSSRSAPPPPRTTTPAASATSDSTAPTTTTPPPSASASPVFSPAEGCIDCERLTDAGSLAPGAELTLSYSGFQPGERITVIMRSDPVELGTFTADAEGVVTADVTIPASAAVGAHTLTLSGPVSGDRIVRFRLAGADSAPADQAPTPAGMSLTSALAVVGGAVALGAAALVGYRRRARRPDAPVATDRAQATATPIAEPIA